jgi:hypothetical protein
MHESFRVDSDRSCMYVFWGRGFVSQLSSESETMLAGIRSAILSGIVPCNMYA